MERVLTNLSRTKLTQNLNCQLQENIVTDECRWASTA